jgi:translocation and assembly module TamA
MSLALLVGCASQQKKDAPVVKDVHISGNDELSSRDIKKKILTEETGWWPFAAKEYFDPITWQSDLKRIQRLYAANGFYQAEIVKDQVLSHPPDDVQLEVQVREGKPTHVGKLDVEGLPPADQAAVMKDLPLAPGAVFREDDWAATKRQLADRLRNRGYAKATVDGRTGRTRAGERRDGADAAGRHGRPPVQRRRPRGGAAAALRPGRVRDDPGDVR